MHFFWQDTDEEDTALESTSPVIFPGEEMIEDTPLFPDAKFEVAIQEYELDDVLTTKDFAVIKIVHDCFCHRASDSQRDNVILLVENTGTGIRTRGLINEMVLSNYRPDCPHCTLVGFRHVRDTVFTPVFMYDESI